MYKIRSLGLAILLAAAIPLRAQEDNSPPKPPAHSYFPLFTDAGNQDQDMQSQQSALNPDENSLTGAQQLTLGSAQLEHSYWVPGFQFQNSFQSNGPSSGAQSGGNWLSMSYILGTLSLLESWRHATLALNYSGGGALSSSSAVPNSHYHQFGLTQAFHWQRWQLQFFDQLSFLPANPFGFGGVSNISTPGVGATLGGNQPGLQPNYVPTQSIYTSFGSRLSNGFVTQIDYSLTRRSSLTAVGSIGILHFLDGNSIDTNDAIFSLGYNYQLTARNTFGLFYRFSGYRYVGISQGYNDHAAQLTFGRKVTGRLALQLFGGPEVTEFRQPIGTATQRVAFSGGATLKYAFKRAELSGSYMRGLSGGSGVLIGSSQDLVQTGLAFQPFRRWQGNLGMGYAHNGQILGNSILTISNAFNSIYASGGLNRSLSPAAQFSVNYTYQHQNTSQSLCPLGSCGSSFGPSFDVHQIWIGFNWRARPFVLH